MLSSSNDTVLKGSRGDCAGQGGCGGRQDEGAKRPERSTQDGGGEEDTSRKKPNRPIADHLPTFPSPGQLDIIPSHYM